MQRWEIIGFSAFDQSFTDDKNYAFLVATPQNEHPELVVLKNGEGLRSKVCEGVSQDGADQSR